LARLDLEAGDYGPAGATALDVLEMARSKQQLQPEAEALELLGDIERAQGDAEAAAAEYETALGRVRAAGWGGKENDLLVKLAELRLDQGDTEAAAPLVGALAGQAPNPRSLEVQARFAMVRGDRDRAVQLMEEARDLAGEAWTPESEALLRDFRAD
jgi:Tfp pilus assembly protein PilF